jgi:uncharacterized membrane protein
VNLSSILPPGFNAAEVVSLSRLPALVLGAAAVALAAAVGLGWLATRGAPLRVRVGLLLLRAGLALAVLALLLEPGLRLMATSREANRIVIAIDTSGSMGEAEGDRTRAQQAAAAARQIVDDASARAQPFAPELWLFDEDWRRASPDDLARLASGALLPEGRQSRLALPLSSITSGEGERPLGGVVVISDGADTAGLERGLTPEVRDAARALGAPLHAVLVGEPARFKDVALDSAIADEFAFVRNKVTVDVIVRHKGFPGQRVPLTLREDGRPVATTEVVLPGEAAGASGAGSGQSSEALGKGEVKATFTFEPQRAGKRVYTISAPVLPDEVVVENNRIDFTLKLIRDRIRVLQVAGRPSWDERFVRRLLKENPSVDLISFFILRSTTDVANASNRELSLIPFPTRELFTEELGTFDVVIFQDFNYRPYQMGMYLENVKRFVEESGGGFMMIGGDLSFSEGEYDGTPVADILPVRLLPGNGHTSTEGFVPLVTDAGRSHPITDLGDVTTGEGYEALPPLEGVNLVAGLAEGAETLLAHPFLNVDGQAAPVVAVREVGKGRSMAVLTDTTWMWSLPHVGSGGRGDAHRRFFANALRWLIRDPELSRTKIVVDLPDAARGVEPGVAVPLEVRTFNARYQPEGGDPVKITLTPLDAPDGTPPTILEGVTGEDGTWRVAFSPPSPGAWRARVEARDAGGGDGPGAAIGADEDAFVVRATATEKLHREPRPDVLQALAGAGGGRFVQADDGTGLPFADKQIERVHRQRTEPLWNQAWSLGVIVVLAGVEWWWRRRRGFA